MTLETRSPALLRFGSFEADVRAGELRKQGVRIKVQEQPFQVLRFLLQRPGEVVTREELRSQLWPADTFVDFDNSLNTSINKLRDALGDSADSPRFIETVPRRGYRFLAPVERDSGANSTGIWGLGSWKLALKPRWISSLAMLLFLLSALGIWRFPRTAKESLLLSGEPSPLTALPGFHAYPAFSPDGNQVAFTIQGEQNLGIYTMLVGGEKPLRLTANGGDSSPTWSPDGRQIAFTRMDGKSLSICVMPALGGTPRKLYSFAYKPPSTMEWVNWAPSGKVLAFTDNSRIQLFSIVDSTIQAITSPPDRSYDYGPVFSPDGSTVAFARGSIAGAAADLFVVPTRGGEPKRLTSDNSAIFGPSAWTPDGREIVFSSSRRGLHNLWRIPASGGTPQLITGVVMASHPSISRTGDLAYLQQLSNENIWRMRLKDPTHTQGTAAPIISAKWQNFKPHFSPDGKRIAFESDRSGYSEIWTCDGEGSNCAQLTSLRGAAGAARWSPDGHYIAFELQRGEHTQVYAAELPDGSPQLVSTFPDADNGAPNWSRDGRWIYFYSDRDGGQFQLWKVPVKGGSPVQVTRNGGVFGTESLDGRFLYYSKYEVPGIWRLALDGSGEETRLLDQPDGAVDWAVVHDGIYLRYLTPAVAAVDLNSIEAALPLSKSNIGFFEFATHRMIDIAHLDRPNVRTGLAVAPNGKSILFVQNEFADSSIMLIKSLGYGFE